MSAELDAARALVADLLADNELRCDPHPGNPRCVCCTARAERFAAGDPDWQVILPTGEAEVDSGPAGPLVFTSVIDLGDGRRISTSIEVPQEHPAGLAWKYVGENSEIAHMAAVSAMRLLHRGDESRARDAAEDAEEVPF
jgi:hypothetical protein